MMQLLFIIMLVIAVPALLLTVIFIWYINHINFDLGKRIRTMRIALEKIARATTKP